MALHLFKLIFLHCFAIKRSWLSDKAKGWVLYQPVTYINRIASAEIYQKPVCRQNSNSKNRKLTRDLALESGAYQHTRPLASLGKSSRKPMA
jgi:hypothetical protein